MRRSVAGVAFVFGLAIALGVVAGSASACTGIRLKAKDGAVVYGRTMEFGFPLQSRAIIIPRHFDLQGQSTQGRRGMAWKTKYAAVGMNAISLDRLVDGVNEKGLAAGIYYMPGYAGYQTISPKDDARALAPWEPVTWLLTTCATVAEARAAIETARVVEATAPELNIVPPVHYVVHDKQGQSLVIEYVRGELHLHDNPLGVMTNAPEFSWHMTNLHNYVNLRAMNSAPVKIDGVSLQPFGQGSGLFGLPGDFTSPSRFVRAALFGAVALEGRDGPEAIGQLFHLLDNFDIPLGSVEQGEGDAKVLESTEWTTASDLKNSVFYFHTFENRRVQRIDLKAADLDSDRIVKFPMRSSQDFEDPRPEPRGK